MAQSKLENGIPILGEEVEKYDSFKFLLGKWCKITKIPPNERANHIILTLRGKALLAAQHMSDEDIESENGVEKLVKVLDSVYVPDKLRHRLDVYVKFSNLTRKEGGSVLEHLNDFQNTFLEFKKLSAGVINYGDELLALQLIKSCRLSETDNKLVLAQMIEPPSSENVSDILKRVFPAGSEEQKSTTENQTSSDVLLSNTESQGGQENTTYFAKGNRGGRGSYRPSFNTRGRQQKRTGSWNRNSSNQPRKNPLGPDGRYTLCSVCDSIWHYFRDCPHMKKVKKDQKNKESSQEVNLSFISFVGCASNDDKKLQQLLDDSKGYAILDSGCSTTVAGEEWFSKYVDNLSVGDKLKIKVKMSDESFTFGDGKTHKAKRRVTFPCWAGGERADMTADIVDCKIPLLLSRKSMSAVGMVLDFSDHTALLKDRKIKLKITSSGHYALPLSL